MIDQIEKPKEITRRYFLSAGETDAEGRLPMSLIFERAIEVATEHANTLGIGYATLIQHGVGWVLSRFSVEMKHYPKINEYYSFTTWIEGFNRMYSDRCFAITDADGNEIGQIRTMWVAIDMQKRTAADLTPFESVGLPISERKCSVPKPRKQPKLSEDAHKVDYTFKFSDLDFNRHVNTVQYIRHILNLWPLSYFDAYQIKTFEIAFNHECYFGETVTIKKDEIDELSAVCEIEHEGQRAVAAAVSFTSRDE